MVEILKSNELLLLFLVIAVGYGLGNIKIKGSSLGVAAVLFVGLAFGALDSSLEVSNSIFLIGLVMFVYTIGLSNGPAFFKNFKRTGFRDFLFVLGMLTLSGALTVGVHFWFDLDASISSGLFAGSSTNTPALAGLLDTINGTQSAEAAAKMVEDAVIGYSLSYPMGVLGVMLSIAFLEKVLKIDFRKEEKELSREFAIGENIENISIKITNSEVEGKEIRELLKQFSCRVVFGRIKKGEEVFLPNWDTKVSVGDQIMLVGAKDQLGQIIPHLGNVEQKKLSNDRSEYNIKRIFVSNPKIAGKTIASLNLSQNYSAIISRIRRGDIDILASNETTLELGDQILYVARRKDIDEIAKLFGNSYEALSHINLLSFGLGVALGLLLGMFVIQLPGDISFSLGFAGGPLIVALLLGALRRTGPIVWTLPYSANRTIRQLGLMLLLASIGIKSGHQFFSTIMDGDAGWIFLGGTIISTGTALITLLIGYKLVKIPFSFLLGMVSNQPAILDFGIQKAGNGLPNFGFTTMFPVALIIKIVYVQILFVILS